MTWRSNIASSGSDRTLTNAGTMATKAIPVEKYRTRNWEWGVNVSFWQDCWQRLAVLWWVKAVGTMGFLLLFFTVYLYLLHHVQFPVTLMPVTIVDYWIGIDPAWLPCYVSLWVYVSLPPALMRNFSELLFYGQQMAWVCIAGLLVFWLYPTAVPQGAFDWSAFHGVARLKTLDAAGNAFPSLHVATAVFSALWLDFLLRKMRAGTFWRLLNVVWCVGIVYSTMAIKQHVLWDVLGGLVLGGSLGVWSLRRFLRWGAVMNEQIVGA